MVSTQRPKPRARKASVDVVNKSTTEGVHSLHLSPSASTRITINVDDNDDDDDFFTRKKVTKAPKSRANAARTQSAPTLDIRENHFSEEDREEVDNEEHDPGSSSSDDEGRRRKRPRQNLSLWTKTASFSKIESSSRQASSSQERDFDEGLTEFGRLQKRLSRSPSLTPPPALEQEVLDKLHSVLEQYNPAKSLDINDDDEDSISHDTGLPLDLDPDLVRLIKGDRARELRKQAKEREARQRQEEERLNRVKRVDIIEVDDSEDDKSQTTMDSSPVEIVSFSFPAKSTAQDPAPAPEPEPVREQPSPVEVEENERISIVMKGGEGGSLQALVKVKPSSIIKKLLDHFKTTHKDSIPKGKFNSVKIRFDGEILDPNMTVEDVGIEDEEQMDVIW